MSNKEMRSGFINPRSTAEVKELIRSPPSPPTTCGARAISRQAWASNVQREASSILSQRSYAVVGNQPSFASAASKPEAKATSITNAVRCSETRSKSFAAARSRIARPPPRSCAGGSIDQVSSRVSTSRTKSNAACAPVSLTRLKSTELKTGWPLSVLISFSSNPLRNEIETSRGTTTELSLTGTINS